MDKLIELNEALDKELEFCENFENLLLQKKELLIHSKAEKLKEFDKKVAEYNNYLCRRVV